MTLDEIFDHGREFAKVTFDLQGEVVPMWIAENEDGDILPIMVPPDAMNEKDRLADALQHLFKEKKIVRYVSLLEAWMITTDVGTARDEVMEELAITPVRERPDRKEIVVIVAEDRYHKKHGFYRIIRPKTGKARLSKFEDNSDGADKSEGRFMNMLKSGTSIQ